MKTAFENSLHKHSLLTLILLIFCSFPSLAQLPLSDDSAKEQSIPFRVFQYSPINQYSLKQDALTDIENWQLLSGGSVYISPKDGVSWLKVITSNPNDVEKTLLLEVVAIIESIELFQLQDLQLVPASVSSGSAHEFTQRDINYRNVVFPLTLDAQAQKTYFIKIRHHFGQRVNVISWDSNSLQAAKSRELIFFGMIYGALWMIILYNLFVFFSTREKNYLFFVLFGTFSGIFISMHEGHFAQFVAPHSNWPKDTFYAIVSALMCFCFTFFCITFLDLERRSKAFYRIMLSAGAMAAIALVVLGINEHSLIFSPYALLIIIALYIPAIAAGFYTRYSGVASAGFFSLAISLCTLGLCMDFLSSMEFVGWYYWTYSYASIGYTAMIIVFALSLADKMRILNEEKLSTTIELVKLTEEKAQSNIEVYKSKLNEVQLEQRADEAKIESRAKSEFLATMSHEIRTPMNGILGMTELLEDTELDQKQQTYMSSITKSAKALLNVINDLLDYSKIESGKIDLEAKVFNLEKVIDDCISISAFKATETKINFIGQITPGTELQLKGDAPKIRQITLNLLSNAFNYAQGQDIYLNIFQTGKKSINSIEIRVEIDCLNTLLDAQQQHAILNPFHNEQKEHKHKGKELGLSVSRQLVDLMHGYLGIDCNEETQVTRFWFTVRLLKPHEDEAQPLIDRSLALSGRRILICDLNNDFMNSIKSLVESWNMQCCTVNSTRDVADKLISDKHSFQVLMIAEELLTPEVQLAVRKSNVDHNFNTSVMLTCRSRFSLTPEEMKKRGIHSILETPYTTSLLYKTLLKSMGIESDQSLSDSEQLPLSVLIAEDNSVNRMVIEGLLKKLNINPAVATNGKEAVELWQQNKDGFDLVLMDCEMPEMDGYEATEKIRELQGDVDDPIIIVGLSAHSSTEHKERAFTSGMNDFIVKPIASGEIEELIDHIHRGKFKQEMASDD